MNDTNTQVSENDPMTTSTQYYYMKLKHMQFSDSQCTDSFTELRTEKKYTGATFVFVFYKENFIQVV